MHPWNQRVSGASLSPDILDQGSIDIKQLAPTRMAASPYRPSGSDFAAAWMNDLSIKCSALVFHCGSRNMSNTYHGS